MRHRTFIAINFPEDIKKELLNYQSKWPELPIRWTKEENLHITLIFIGYASDEDTGEICKITKEVVSRYKSFFLNLDKICYGPPKKMPPRPPKFLENLVVEESENKSSQKFWRPRMIWVEGERVKELSDLKSALENSLSGSGIRFEAENREFRPHTTLGRIRTWEWRQIEPEERPEVEEEISLSFEVKSIEIMESRLKRGGAEYSVLETCSLRE